MLVVLVFLFLGSFASVFAQKNAETKEVNSFELFWPVVAGRTMGDSLYRLKIFKENVRGALIFGKSQKVDYEVFLSIKRAVEAEKLLADGKVDLAKKTLEKMSKLLDEALSNLEAAQGERIENIDEVNKRLDNLEIFLPHLASRYEQVKDELQRLLGQVEKLNQGI